MPPMCSATHEEPQEKRKECHPCSLKTPSTLTTPKAALHTLHEDPQPCSHASKLQQVSHTHNSYSIQGIKKETSTQGAQSKTQEWIPTRARGNEDSSHHALNI